MKKHDFTDLIIAGSSILFMTTILPLFDSLVSMATSLVNKTINGWQLDMQLDQASAEVQANQIGDSCNTNVIGFEVPSVEEDYEEDEDDE